MAAYPKELKKTTNLAKSNVRAGKSKATTAQRKAQNRGVKDGTVRLGKSGKTYNVYDAKSGTWKRGVVKTAGKSSGSSKPMTGRGGYGSPNRIQKPRVRKFIGGTSRQEYDRPGNQPIFDIPAFFRKTDVNRRRNRALGAAKVTAKRPTGARAQSGVYRRERRLKKK